MLLLPRLLRPINPTKGVSHSAAKCGQSTTLALVARVNQVIAGVEVESGSWQLPTAGKKHLCCYATHSAAAAFHLL